MVQAIIFDCFGVLATEAWAPFRDEYFGTDATKLQEANSLLRQFTTGRMTDITFRKSIAQLSGLTPEEVGRRVYANVPNVQLFDYMQTFDPAIKIAMLSNAGKNRLSQIFTTAQLALFDVCALSSEIGYAKPDVQAYNHVVQLLGVQPEECVFVDDQPRFLDGAEAVGLRPVLYSDFSQFRNDLETLLTDS
jgi:HAD superfamily hydrolase (TIGR01509 family)